MRHFKWDYPLWKLCFHFLNHFLPEKPHFCIVFETDKSYLRLNCSETIYHNKYRSTPIMLILLVKHEIFSHSTLFCQHGKKTKIFKNPEMQEVQTRPSASPRTRRQSDSPMEHLLNVQYLNSRSKSIQLLLLTWNI